MYIFKKDKKKSKNSSKKNKKFSLFNRKDKPKKKIGIKKTTEEKEHKTETNEEQKVDQLLHKQKELSPNQEIKNSKQKKKKKYIKKDYAGKPVFLEDTGEKLGKVQDTIYDEEKRLVGYKIKDEKSDAVLSFPPEQFEEDKKGLIFTQGWYTNALKIIEKLEFKDKTSPELTALLKDNSISNKDLYDIFVKHDDEMVNYIEDALSLKELLNKRLQVLQKERVSLKDELMDLTEKRLIKDIDRKEFSEDVDEHRRKVNILDVNIKKCKQLLEKLENTSFGIISKDDLILEKEGKIYNPESFNSKLEENTSHLTERIQNPYKEKYFTLKEKFEQLEDEYQELKTSVESLFNKSLEK